MILEMNSLDVQQNIPEVKVKMYCIFAMESVKKMGGIRGKLGTQAGHAYLHAFWNAMDNHPEFAKAYRDTSHAYKITLVVDTVEELLKLRDAYKDKTGVSLVKDAGFTVFNEPTVTCLGIGPLPDTLKGEDLAAIKTLT
jgi:peptidyl-tRNA hydrolase